MSRTVKIVLEVESDGYRRAEVYRLEEPDVQELLCEDDPLAGIVGELLISNKPVIVSHVHKELVGRTELTPQCFVIGREETPDPPENCPPKKESVAPSDPAPKQWSFEMSTIDSALAGFLIGVIVGVAWF